MFSASSPLTILTLVMALTTSYTRGANIATCEYDEDSCGCKTDLGLISLKKFAGKSLTSAVSSTGDQYTWNPCKDVTEGSITAACIQSYPEGGLYYDCGMHYSTETSVVNGKAVFSLTGDVKVRRSQVTCVCGCGDVLKFLDENPTAQYNLQLTSRACCAGGYAGESSGLSVGSILLIVLLAVVIVYLLVGVVVQVGVRKAEGRERIPNVALWTAVPGLIKDGVRFTFSRGKATDYDKI